MSIFTNNVVRKPERSRFNLSFENKLTCNFGELVPCLCKEVVPGDIFRCKSEVIVRMMPMLAPILQNIDVYTHYFFVPNRIIWDGWQDFITGGPTGNSATEAPFFLTNSDTVFSLKNQGWYKLMDYLGVNFFRYGNDDIVGAQKFSQLPFRAYNLIYNEFYRDENFQDAVDIYKGTNGNLTMRYEDASAQAFMKIKYRSWKKDYFSSALPWTQRGNAASVPLGTSAPLKQASGAAISFNPEAAYDLATDGNGELIQKGTANYLQYLGGLYADLSQASGMTINSFRRAMALQKWLERNAIGGSRYIEQILAHFGVRVPDYKLARPVYLGGGKYPITVSEVLQTSQTSSTSPQANMAGHGISAGLSNGFQYMFPEHGFVMCIMSIMPKAAYFQGLSKMFTRESRYDYFWPEFAHLGEQEVREYEVYNQGSVNGSFNTMLFGYQSRYAEYKQNLDEIHGDFKSSLRYWHCGRKFDTLPELEEEFSLCGGTAEAQANLNNIFAVTDANSDHFIVDLFHDLKGIRPMPKYGTPSI